MEAPRGVERSFPAIFSADVAGYSCLMAEGEVATLQGLTAERELMTDLVRQHHGRVVDSSDGNLLAEFPSALDATQCAVEVQRALRARNADLPWHRLLQRSASESGRLRHGDEASRTGDSAGGC